MPRRRNNDERPQRSKRHRLTNQEITDLLVRYERVNQRDREEVWR